MVALNNLHDIVQNFVHLSAKEQLRSGLMHFMLVETYSFVCSLGNSKLKLRETRRIQHSQECKDPRRHCFFVTVTLTFLTPK